ncbi:MAG: SLC26A/SulP transporter family protein [Deltaproteobacteria bacterium]|jgi:sulfate permease, SulP family|nr:SLC26A/SulP transporter family protein [Deltaproteobacteria bacterium]
MRFKIGNFKGDFFGGLVCAVSSLPSSLAYGLVAFSPLGADYLGFGLQAGLYSAIIVGFFTAIFGGTKLLITGPKAPETLIIAATLAQLISTDFYQVSPDELITLAITAIFLMIALSGLIQIMLGTFGIGRLIKFIPFPVIAGFMNGSAILILNSQVWEFTGIEKKGSLIDFIKNIAQFQPLTLLIAAITLLVMHFTPKFTQKIPGSILGLITGTLLYQFLKSINLSSHLSSTIGAIPIQLPTPDFLFGFMVLFQKGFFWETIIRVLPGAIGIAILGTITSLLASHVISELSGTTTNSNRELIGQGIGKIAVAVFGGISATGTLSRSLANYNAGGRSRLSIFLTSTILLVIVLVMAPVMALIPKAVIAGMLFALAFKAFDKQSVILLVNAIRNKDVSLTIHLSDLIIILSVTLVTVFFNLVIAVGFGVAISIGTFLIKTSKSIIRKVNFGSAIRSKKTRNEEMIEILSSSGNQISVIELEGSLFFGSADVLSVKIEELAKQDVKYFILDMKRVIDIDSTGSNICEQLYNRQRKQGRYLAVSYIKNHGKIWSFLKETTSLLEPEHETCIFPETDLALEQFEDMLIKENCHTLISHIEISMEKFPFMRELSRDEKEVLHTYLDRQEFKKGDVVFRQGDKSNTLFFITKGAVDITINIDNQGNKIRVSTISSGTFFGEIALLDNTPRSANVEASEDLVTYVLTREAFETFKEKHPTISIALLTNISKLFAARLRAANQMISELEK